MRSFPVSGYDLEMTEMTWEEPEVIPKSLGKMAKALG